MSFFPVPVRTQEPVSTRERVVDIRGNHLYFTGAQLSAANPMLFAWDVPMGCNWRVLSIIVRWAQNVAQQQTLALGLSQRPGTPISDIIWDTLRTAINANQISIHQVMATVDGGAFNYAVANGVGNYNTTWVPLPNVWIQEGQQVNLAFHNANVADDAHVYISYEEERVLP